MEDYGSMADSLELIKCIHEAQAKLANGAALISA